MKLNIFSDCLSGGNEQNSKKSKGLGVNESGITEALKPKLKFDTSGIGHDAAEQFTYHWWENAYNQAAENLEVCRNEDGVAVKVNDDSFDISTRKYLVKSSRTGSALLYGNFLKTSTLTGDGHIVQECGEELSQSIKLVSAVTLTDEELLKACGGLTAHKGARHGLTLSGKLSRIQEQERKLLDSMNNKENAVEYVTVEDLCNGKEKKKKNKKKRVNEESAGIEDLATFETIEPQGKKKKKNKNKEVSELLESNLASCENNENVSNVDESAGFEDLATAGSIEPQRKKKKKNKNKEVGELSESNIASCENNEDVSNVDESAKIEDLTTVGSTQHKKKKKKKNKEVSVNDENKNTEASYVQENGRKKKYEDPNESADQTLSADVDELTVKSRKKKKDAHSHVLNGKLEENCVDTSSVSYCIPEEMGDTKRKCKKKEDLSTEMENETRTSGDALTNIDYPSHTTKTRPPLTWRETPEGWLCCHCAAGEDANLNNSLSNGDAHAPQKKKKKKKHKEKKDNGDNISSPSVERNTVDQPDSILYDTSTFDEHNSQNKKHHKGRRLNSEQLPQSQDKQEVEGDGEQENGECFPDATLEHSAEGSALLGNTSEVTDSSSKKKKWKEKHLENGDEANDVLENISGVSKKGKKKKKRESENPEQESTVPQKKVKMPKKEAVPQRKVIRVVGKDEKGEKASENPLLKVTETESDDSDDSGDDEDDDNLHLKEIKPTKNGEDADLHTGCVWEGVDALEFPEDVMFPEEYNRFLRDKLDILTSQNGRMQRSMEELEAELKQLKEKQLKDQDIQLMSPLAGLGRASELASSKIVELSKRVRELTAEVEILRTRCRTAETKLALQQDKLEDAAKKSQEQLAEEPSAKDEVKILTERLQMANSKLCECRNQNQSLRQELKVAHKALVNEVGDSVPLVSVLNMNSNWRGRAQQILALQQKVAELQEQLTDKPASLSSIENRNLSSMRQKEKERRLAQEQTNQELKDSKALLEDTNRRLEGFKARAKALETEMAGLKTRLNSLLEKAKHDDQLIVLLNNEVTTAECKMKNQDQTFQQDMERMNAEQERLEQEISKEKCKVGQLEAALTDKQAVIERLTQQIQNMTSQQELIPNRPKTRDDDSIPRSPASSKPSSQHDYMQSPSTSECQVLSQAAEAERVRLLELLAVMNRRLDEQRCIAAQAEEAFRRERHKAARLETKVARLELEKTGTSRAPSYGNSRRTQEREAVMEELNSRIELLEEEILALRTRVQCIQQEKQDDLRTYTSLLEQARSTFLKAQRSQTSSKKNKNISL